LFLLKNMVDFRASGKEATIIFSEKDGPEAISNISFLLSLSK
jgi:hypothetical protein